MKFRILILAVVLIVSGILSAQGQQWDPRSMGGVHQFRPGEGPYAGETAPPPEALKSSLDDGSVQLWLFSYDGIPGHLDEDLIDESSVVPVCEGQSLGNGAAGSAYLSTYGIPYSNQWNAYYDSETCSTRYDDIVRYTYTQVRVGSEKDLLMSLNYDDDIKIWFNGVEIYRGENGDFYGEAVQLPVHLVRKWNSILVKQHFPDLSEDAGYHYADLKFLEVDGVTPAILTQIPDGWCNKTESTNWIFFPGVAELPGALGSHWSSDLRLTNNQPFKTRVTIEYFREGNAHPAKGAEPDVTTDIVLAAGESRFFSRVLSSLFGLSNQKGMLAIRGWDRGYAMNGGGVGLRTYNRSGSGSFGMQIPPMSRYSGSSYLSGTFYGLKNGPDFRSNFGGLPLNTMDTGIDLTITLFDPVSGRTGSASYRIEGGVFQINNIFAAVGMADVVTDQAIAKVSGTNDDSATYWSYYASVNDNTTSDPSYVERSTYYYPAWP